MAYNKQNRKKPKKDNKKQPLMLSKSPSKANGKVSFSRPYNAQMNAESEGPTSSGKTHPDCYIK